MPYLPYLKAEEVLYPAKTEKRWGRDQHASDKAEYLYLSLFQPQVQQRFLPIVSILLFTHTHTAS